MSDQQQGLDTWAVVELLGHRQIAGRVTEEPVAGTNMLRVDVPAVDEWPAHTKYFGGGSIYAIHPCTEDIARKASANLAAAWGYTPMPVSVPELSAASSVIREARAARSQQLPAGRDDDADCDQPEEHDSDRFYDTGF